jgi:hypothetical protein
MTSENMARDNPYANYGSPVTGAAFVGRADHVRSIRSRTFTAMEAASVSIVGPPRVGKSSLAQQVLDEFAVGKNPAGRIFVPIWITVGGATSEQALFRELAHLILDWLDEHGLPTDRLHGPYAKLTAAVSWDEMGMCLKDFLRQVRRAGYQVVVVLDEFDAARTVFHRAAPFELLRAIAHERTVRVALITTSRRTLAEIVVKSTAEVSTFAGIFGLPLTLGCFTAPELTALIARSPYTDKDLRDSLFTWLQVETGGHPFLSSALLSVLHDRWAADGPPALDDLPKQCRDAVGACGQFTVDYYKEMLELLREEDRLGQLLEVLFGPQETVRPTDADRMVGEGIIKQTDDGWAAFSESFSQYLLLLEGTRTSDNWQLWHRTETGLRAALTSALEQAYGETWRTRLAQSQKKLVLDCQTRQARDRAFGDVTTDDDLLEYALPKDLLAIMMMHWDHIEPVFGHGKEEWRQRVELIAKVRNPMAHNRRAAASPALMEQFRAVCREILDWLAATAADQPA